MSLPSSVLFDSVWDWLVGMTQVQYWQNWIYRVIQRKIHKNRFALKSTTCIIAGTMSVMQ